MKSLGIIATALLAAVHTTNAFMFKVIAPDADDTVQVEINGRKYALNATDPDVPYYTGDVDYKHGDSYKYVVDGKAEDFTRSIDGGSSTRNEFFGRKVTYANLPEIPTILSEGAWTRGDVSHPIWDTNYIVSIFVTGDEDDMDNLIENVPTDVYKTKITYIGPDEVYTFKNCKFGLHKPGRKNNDAKQTWIWSLPENTFIANRNWFKIRHMEEDPTQLREKLYADISRSMGTYANAANMVRFYINKEGMGTFNMLDDVIMYSYINAMFYAGDAPSQMGGLYDGASGADFNPKSGYDSFIPNVASPMDQDAIDPFMEAFSNVDFDDDDEVEAISQYFDYDQFLRFQVMEYLTGSWDGYWQEQTNDGAFIELAVEPAKMYYLGQDFDATFGVNLPFDKDFVKKTYPDYLKQFKGAYLMNKLLSNDKVNAKFYHYLKTTYEEIFNLDVLKPIVEARHEFYMPDIEWDRSIKQRSPGNIFGWTAEQSTANLYKPVTAKGDNTGGAEFGLLQWVEEMADTCRKFFEDGGDSKKVAEVVKDSVKQAESNVKEIEAGVKQASAKEDEKPLEAASISNKKTEQNENVPVSSTGQQNVPQILSAVAIIAAVVSLF